MRTSIIQTMGVSCVAKSYEATLKNADLNWEVSDDKVRGVHSGVVVPNKKMLYRTDTKQALGIVGKDYQPSDPKEFLKTCYEFAHDAKGSVVQAGFLPERSRAFSFVKLTDGLDLPESLRKKGDPIAAYIYSTDGWDGATPRRSALYLERLACANGMISRALKASLWVSHTSNSKTLFDSRNKTFLHEVRENLGVIQKEFIELAKARMSLSEAKEFLGKLIPGEGTAAQERRDTILGLFAEGTGNEGKSRWDAYNAVTEYVTHVRPYRKSENVSQETNRFLGVLETDLISKTAYQLLLN